MMAEKKEEYPLHWPQEWPRTRPQDRRDMKSWKGTANKYRDALITEMERMQCPAFVISSNVALTQRSQMVAGIEPVDVGVSVYFSRKLKEDFSWQDALSIHDPAPTEEQITASYRRLAQKFHPDVPGGDAALFSAVTRHRDNAMRYIKQQQHRSFDYVIACDSFISVRLNMAAIVSTIKAIRAIERAGTSSLMERAFKGFSALPAQGGSSPASDGRS